VHWQGGQAKPKVENVPPVEKAKARDAVGKAVGASGRTLPWALPKGAPELIQAVDEGRFSLSAAEAAQEL
jgi:hypothetical protein